MHTEPSVLWYEPEQRIELSEVPRSSTLSATVERAAYVLKYDSAP